LGRIEARREAAEAAAGALVGELGRLCANFDFFFKHDMTNGAFRPVRCSLSGRDETVLFAYGFDTAQTQQAWVSEWGNLAAQRGATLVEEETWAVEVLDASIVEEVRSIVFGTPWAELLGRSQKCLVKRTMLILLTSGAEALKQGGAEEGPDQTFQPVARTGFEPVLPAWKVWAECFEHLRAVLNSEH
jgi:hypothetical protein